MKKFSELVLENLSSQVINVDRVMPDGKDYDRAEGLQFLGPKKTFFGSGAPHASNAVKMAKAIKDKVKLVRRSKAVVSYYGTKPKSGASGGVWKEQDVWTPFKTALDAMGFTKQEIDKISKFKGKALPGSETSAEPVITKAVKNMKSSRRPKWYLMNAAILFNNKAGSLEQVIDEWGTGTVVYVVEKHDFNKVGKPFYAVSAGGGGSDHVGDEVSWTQDTGQRNVEQYSTLKILNIITVGKEDKTGVHTIKHKNHVGLDGKKYRVWVFK